MSCPSKHVEAPNEEPQQALTGRAFWRSLDELSQTPQFQEALHREYPRGASEWHDDVSRRNFLKLMSASLALAGVYGCARPEEQIVPYVIPPENQLPGKPLYYATAFPLGGYGLGVLAEQHMGRPTKIEGNPDHPASLGATDVHAQASVLSLYDPAHPETPKEAGEIRTWTRFFEVLRKELDAKKQTAGAGFRILTETVTSPTLISQIQALLKQFPQAKWHHYEPINFEGARAGAIAAFGRPVNTIYRFDKAQRILSLDSDFLMVGPASVRYNSDYAHTRRVRSGTGFQPVSSDPKEKDHGQDARAAMSRMYAVQSTPTITATMADHRWPMRAGEVEGFARAVLAQVQGEPVDHPLAAQIALIVADLKEHQGRSVVVPGEYQPVVVHAIAHALNAALGAVGQTVVYTEPIEVHESGQLESIRALVKDMDAGQVDMLLVLGSNPVFTAPADLKFREAYGKVRLRIQQSLYYDETSFHSHWHVPESHYLETWSDIRAFDGTVTIIQPLIQALHQSRSPHELLAFMLGFPDVSAREIIREAWRSRAPAGDFETFWMRALEKGVVENTAAPVVNVTLQPEAVAPARNEPSQSGAAAAGYEVIFRPDPAVWDGRFANNGWLQEFPRPLTKLTWDNVAIMSVRTAVQLGLTQSIEEPASANEQLVRLTYAGNSVEAPVWVMAGHPDNSVTVLLGGGREVATPVGKGVGFNGYRIRPSTAMWFGQGLEVEKLGRRYPLACTQPHQMLEGRDHLRVHTLEEFRNIAGTPQTPHTVPEPAHGKTVHLSFYPDRPEPDEWLVGTHQWGMAIDQNVCTGCSACVLACQAENNIPIVGKDQVLNGREMHWLRIDTYYRGESTNPEGPYFQPMLCQHCEKAPCEIVCPVEATSHSVEGINEMTYNRCIGTRYCSNNCPYKVRRFNFLQYAEISTPILQLVHNPDVTVRQRGVMEKCTYCIQRINTTRREIKTLRGDAVDAPQSVKAEVQARVDALMDTLQTACQQACPTEAIVFGDIMYEYANGQPMAVTRLKTEPHNYGVLTELNTNPRTTYLARLTNPNPAIGGPKDTSAEKRTAHDAARG
ncbi:MAG TPA: TAT-variant-translocated molybdopterin oxidoreductase [Tepidisphaeraceae bacterium]|nr:TAT-variant-translocated molybdopterin oxidoreductase [Tepidisphaeraceae bacterium]